MNMIKYSGKTVYAGIAMGKVCVFKRKETCVSKETNNDTQTELARLKKAIHQSKEQLGKLYDKALDKAGKESAAIFEVHQMMIEDDDYLEAITNMIEADGVNAEFAVAAAGDNFYNVFAVMDDDYMKARAADIKDISDRIISNLSGNATKDFDTDEPVIIVADDLSLSEMVLMDKNKILAFVTVHGSINSHTAIFARMMNIPALVGVDLDLDSIENGSVALVDGINGQVTFNPTPSESLIAMDKIKKIQEQDKLLDALKGKDTVTLSGRKIKLYANICNLNDIEYVLANDAEGIGLMRSEFLYIGRDDLPTEEEQFLVYKQIAQTMGDKKVIIRTMDIGADKQTSYLDAGQEDNPALGYRGIRICLKQPTIFKHQLRALLRAAVYGNISIMYPMIISVDEVKQIYRIVDEVAKELEVSGIEYKIPEQGIMIETPAAVMISDELAKLVDFFSIGTNDLTQYTLAIDRHNERLDDFYDAHHPAILRMIKMVVANAHAEGKWVGICGELAADTELTKTFVEMGVDELSVSPSNLLKLKQHILQLEG